MSFASELNAICDAVNGVAEELGIRGQIEKHTVYVFFLNRDNAVQHDITIPAGVGYSPEFAVDLCRSCRAWLVR